VLTSLAAFLALEKSGQTPEFFLLGVKSEMQEVVN
jgi:hypothetical protein